MPQIEFKQKSETFHQHVQYCQGENLTAAPEMILETANGQDKNYEEVKSKKYKLHEPITYQTQVHLLCSCLNFCNLTEKNKETHTVDANDSGAQFSLSGIKNKNKHETENTWLAAIMKDRPLCSSFTDRDGNVEDVEARQKLANDSIVGVGFLEGGTKTMAECYDNFHDLNTVSVQAGQMVAPNKSKFTSFSGNEPLCSWENNSSCQLFDLNVSVLDEH